MRTGKKILSAALVWLLLAVTPPAGAALAAGVGIDADGAAIAVGDTVYFGNYPQTEIYDTAGLTLNADYVGYDGKNFAIEPIAWKVLDNSGGELFLLAEKNLDAKAYNTEYTSVTWETSTLRSWLNGDFYQAAFSAKEQAAIKLTNVANGDNPDYSTPGGNNTEDRVFLLSIAEAANTGYGFTGDYNSTPTRAALNTGYTAAHPGMYDAGTADIWWLRSPGHDDDLAALV